MDIKAILNKLSTFAKKYRFALLILLVGIALMLIPGIEEEEVIPQQTYEKVQGSREITSEHLSQILSRIEGAGKTEVLLTCASGERTQYLFNERTAVGENSSDLETEAVIITGTDRKEEALITQVFAPEYLGAVVVCEGAEDPRVALAVSDAVSKATGLGTDRISVCKME